MPTLPFSSPQLGKFNATPMYAYDASISGYRPLVTTDFGGSSSISGATLSAAVNVTGFLGQTASPLNITGKFSNSGFMPSGVAVNVTGLPTGIPLGTLVPFLFDSGNGALIVEQGNLNYSYDNVAVYSPIESGYTTNPIKTGNGLALPQNNARTLLSIQNLNTGLLYYSWTGSPTPSQFHGLLKGGVSLSDGNGGVLSTDQIHAPVYISGQNNIVLASIWESY